MQGIFNALMNLTDVLINSFMIENINMTYFETKMLLPDLIIINKLLK